MAASWADWKSKQSHFDVSSSLILWTTMNHFLIGLWHAMKSGFYMTTSDDQLSSWMEKKLHALLKASLAPQKNHASSPWYRFPSYWFSGKPFGISLPLSAAELWPQKALFNENLGLMLWGSCPRNWACRYIPMEKTCRQESCAPPFRGWGDDMKPPLEYLC